MITTRSATAILRIGRGPAELNQMQELVTSSTTEVVLQCAELVEESAIAPLMGKLIAVEYFSGCVAPTRYRGPAESKYARCR